MAAGRLSADRRGGFVQSMFNIPKSAFNFLRKRVFNFLRETHLAAETVGRLRMPTLFSRLCPRYRGLSRDSHRRCGEPRPASRSTNPETEILPGLDVGGVQGSDQSGRDRPTESAVVELDAAAVSSSP